jgi:ParB-like chromosome segregation protein Spo0J
MEHVTVIETRDVPVGEIAPHPANANRGNADEIAQRLREMGQYRTIVVHQPTGHILAGNTVYRAARDKLGWTHIRAELVNCTDQRALEILAWDNRARDLSLGYDEGSLLSLLTDLERAGSLSMAGYTGNDLDDLRAALEELDTDPAIPPSMTAVSEDIPARTLDEQHRDYAASDTRSIMLMLSGQGYVHLIGRLDRIQEHLETSNYSDTVAALAQAYCDEHGLGD